MATEVKRRRGTTVEHSTFTGAVAELTVDLTKDTVVVHDGATQGGFPLLREDFDNVPTTAPFTHITLDTAIFDTAYTETESETQGTLYWNQDEETLSLVTNGQTIELGQKTEIHVKNQTGAQIDKGEVVYASGTVGNSGRILITKMIADGTVPAKRIMGVTAENIANGVDGKIITFGKLKNINTSSFSDGDILYASATTAGALQNTEPSQANGHVSLPIAYVIHAHSNGQIFIRVTPIDENEYQNYDAGLADIAGLTPTDSTIIVGDGTNWVAESGATARASLGLTIGTHVQAWDAQLDDIAGLTPTDGNFIVGNGSNFVAESGNTARTSLGLGTSDDVQFDDLTLTGVLRTNEIDAQADLVWDDTNNTEIWNTSDYYINGALNIASNVYITDQLDVGESLTVGTTLDVTGNTTISGTLDAPTLNTGQGDNELYAMNQNVRTSDSVTFGALTVSGATILSSTLQVDGTVTVNDDIETADFSSWFTTTPSGFQISQAGVGDFRTLYIDELVAKAFTADVAQALAGSDILTKSVAKLNASFVVPSVGASVSITVEDLEGLSGLQVFEAGDHVRARVVDSTSGLTILDVYGTVSNYASVAGGTQTWDYTITYAGASNGAVGKTVNKGNILLDYGTSGSFYIERTVLDRSSGSDFTKVPYNRIVQWTNTVSGSPRAGDPDTVITVITQSGNLANLTSTYSNVSGFGFFGDNTFLTGSLLVGDLSKAGNYLEYTGSTMNVVTDTFALTAGSMTIDSTNGVVVDSNNFFKQDSTFSFGGGLLSGTSSTLAISGSGASINVSTFDLDATDLDITNSNGGLIQIAHDTTTIPIKFGKTNVGNAPNYDGKYGLEIGSNNYWKVVDGFTTAADYVEFRVGTGTNFIDFDGTNIDIDVDTFDLTAGSMTIDSTDGITIGANDFFKQDKTFSFGGGILSGTSSTVSISGSGATIDVSTFNLNATTLVIDSATNSGKIALGATPPSSIASGSGIYFDGTGDALIGDATGNRIKFDFSASALEIQSDDFDLSAGNLLIDSGTTSLGGYTPTNATSIITNADFSSTVNFKDHPLDPSTPSNPSGDFGYLDDSVGWEADRTGSSTFSYDASGDYVQFTIDSSNGSNAIKMWQDEGWSDSGTSGTLSSYFGKTLTYTFDIRTAPTANGFQYGELFLRVYAYKNITDNTQASGYDYFQIAETKIVPSDLSGSSSTSIDVSAVIRSDYQAIRWSVEFDNFDTTSKAQDQYIFVYDVTLGAYDQTKVTLNSNGLSVFNSPIKQFTADSNGFEMVGMDIKTGGLQVPDIGSVQNLKTPDVGYLSVGAVDVGSSFRLYIKDSDGNAKYVTISTS